MLDRSPLNLRTAAAPILGNGLDLWLRFALAGARVVRIPDVMGASHEHASQKTTGEELYLWQIVGILREYGIPPARAA